MKKILIATILSIVLTMGLGVASGSVSASEIEQTTHTLSNDDIKSLKEFFKTYKVSKDTQYLLIDKLNKGELWDSLKGQEPVSVSEIEVRKDVVETIATYNDGSIVVSGFEPDITEEVAVVSPFAVDPGTVTGGSGYTNHKGAKVYVYVGVANAHFYSDFTLVNGGNDYISSVYDYKIVGIGGAATYNNLAITKKTESLDGKASAKLDFTWIAFNGSTSATCWLRLNVGGDTYGSTYSY